MGKQDTKGLTVKKADNLSDWYSEVVQKAELVDYAPIKGFMIIRPNGYALWEGIQNYFNAELKERGVKNAYFPMLIPKSFFTREAEHAEGFAPELAYIEGTGESTEGDKLALRPTSETIMYDSYAKWIRSHRDLPLLINQWCNIVRWEVKQTKPFLRTREFLWQEGHCAFATEQEAEQNMQEMITSYKQLSEELLAIPVIVGKKSEGEKFPGALTTMTIEALMPDGKALQMGTSHNLGQGFAKVFDVTFQGEDHKEHHAWQTSWGFSTRLLGAITMMHGDDKGIVLPPRLASHKAVIVPILFDKTKKQTLAGARHVQRLLKEHNVILDDREEYNPGWKFSQWELQGIPLRIEVGPKDIEKQQVTVVRRDTGEKIPIKESLLKKRIPELLELMHQELFAKAKVFFDSRIDSAASLDELTQKVSQGKIVKAYLSNDSHIEEQLQEKTGGASSRIIEGVKKAGTCIITGKSTKTLAWIAKSY